MTRTYVEYRPRSYTYKIWLIDYCSGEPVGKYWIDRFIKRTPELHTRWTRPYDHQRALCEDPAIIKPWFTLVQNMKAKYGIVDDDMYNFNESSFLIGKISS